MKLLRLPGSNHPTSSQHTQSALLAHVTEEQGFLVGISLCLGIGKEYCLLWMTNQCKSVLCMCVHVHMCVCVCVCLCLEDKMENCELGTFEVRSYIMTIKIISQLQKLYHHYRSYIITIISII